MNVVMNNDVVVCEFCHDELTEEGENENYLVMGTSSEECSSCGEGGNDEHSN